VCCATDILIAWYKWAVETTVTRNADGTVSSAVVAQEPQEQTTGDPKRTDVPDGRVAPC